MPAYNCVMRAVLVLLLAVSCFAQKRDAEFGSLADRYFDECLFHFDPVYGTQSGFHQYDPLLPAASRAEIDQQIETLKKFEAGVAGFSAQGLSPSVASDRDLLLSSIRGQLLTLETIRPWEK